LTSKIQLYIYLTTMAHTHTNKQKYVYYTHSTQSQHLKTRALFWPFHLFLDFEVRLGDNYILGKFLK